ncbi:MAG: histidine phosphatase family protein [Patescibacteria group bacterium]|nr:histidine phosphatase family protein [Patescibacteria group bacterium]
MTSGSTTILLIRHGDTGVDPRAQKPEDGLCEHGRKEVQDLAQFLSNYPIVAYYSSPYQRARDTAAVLAGDSSVRVDSRLREIPLWTDPLDLSEDETRLEMAKILVEAQEGVEGVLEDVRENYAGSSVALVCHGNMIRATLALTLKMSLETAVRLQTYTASLSVLEYRPQGYYLLRLFNSKPYIYNE